MNTAEIPVAENDFPAGMRVLAVDDDPTSLKLLENLLEKCQYNVTTTTDAETALDRLRDNPNNFDLVVTDVKMPNMDGFRLLELVGHEMNLPVIMLSVDDNPELVLEGIKHGACDYLVKPVRIEELKNIWQHVYRKRFSSRRKWRSTTQGNVDHEAANGGQQHVPNVHEESNRKRNREGEESDQDNRQEIDESGNQKKHRVVWCMDLHDKFVAAVNQLGMDKAVPKSILELMDVDGLTRENVASHLQKYRQYLRRMDEVNGHQANVAAEFGGSNAYAYDVHRYPSSYISPSYQQAGILGSISNPIRISQGNPALFSQAIQPYSNNTMMFQPPGIGLQTIRSSNLSSDPTLFSSNVGAPMGMGIAGKSSVSPSGNPSSQFSPSEGPTLGWSPHLQYNPLHYSSVNAINPVTGNRRGIQGPVVLNQTPELRWDAVPMPNQFSSHGSSVMDLSRTNFNKNNGSWQ